MLRTWFLSQNGRGGKKKGGKQSLVLPISSVSTVEGGRGKKGPGPFIFVHPFEEEKGRGEICSTIQPRLHGKTKRRKKGFLIPSPGGAEKAGFLVRIVQESFQPYFLQKNSEKEKERPMNFHRDAPQSAERKKGGKESSLPANRLPHLSQEGAKIC